ncbi:YfhO family protein [Patescibacteria group bacterium]|nr:YfhO family protein [Patescibacteria group bacterium]
MTKQADRSLLLLTLLFSLFLTIAALVIKPKMVGDGWEYFSMSQSLINHFSADLTPADEKILLEEYGFDSNAPGRDWYFTAVNGKRYSPHFWLYPLTLVPARTFLRLLHLDEVKCFQLTNVFFLVLSLLAIAAWQRHSTAKKTWLILLLSLSPVFWYLFWTGPEVFMAALVVLSLLSLDSKHLLRAILFSALAATQNPSLIFLVLYYCLLFLTDLLFSAFKEGKKAFSFRRLFFATLISLISLLPFVYYYLSFGSFHLLTKTGAAGWDYISLKRVSEFYFDLNFGLFIYFPSLLILLAVALSTNVSKIKKNWRYWLIIPVILLANLISVSTANWNSGTAGFGPLRYSVWVLPVLIFLTVSLLPVEKITKVKTVIILTFVFFSQTAIFMANGGFNADPYAFVKHNFLAEKVLEIKPSWYHPSFEIFWERTLGKEELEDPVIFDKNGRCRKALASYNSCLSLVGECGFIPDKYSSLCQPGEIGLPSDNWRLLEALEASFWPVKGQCVDTGELSDYPCFFNQNDFALAVGLKEEDWSRVVSLGPGAWEIKYGALVKLKLPPGYIAHKNPDYFYVDY